MVSLDKVLGEDGVGTAHEITFLPEPTPRERYYTLISVDDHIVEPPETFEGRMPTKFAEEAPRVVELESGGQAWAYDGQLFPNMGLNAVAGRPPSEYSSEPARFEQMRRGAWDIHARIDDMNLNGVWASMNFPSFLPGFSGQRIQLGHSPELATATVRAWNDFHLEVWTGSYPDRIIPLQLPLLHDPLAAAEEIRRNAERGFHAVTFSESPDKLGLPSIYTDHWDPFLAACEETGTVICLHFGSSGTMPSLADDAPPDALAILFGMNIGSAVDWLYSKVPVRFPEIKLCLSEGGIGWVPAVLDRLDHTMKYRDMFSTWDHVDLTPSELFQRNFWFCAIDEPSALANRERIGIDHILVESDYPHADSSWPNTQDTMRRFFEGVPADAVRAISWENASDLFQHPVPAAVAADPDAY